MFGKTAVPTLRGAEQSNAAAYSSMATGQSQKECTVLKPEAELQPQ